MSYCVNCGVELEPSQKNCPLCGTKVINPAQMHPPQDEKTFAPHKDELQTKDRLFWIKFISILLAVPIVTCAILNWLMDGQLTWSIYVIAGVFIVWALSTSPFYFHRFDMKKTLAVDLIAILIGLFLIEYQAPGKGWVYYVALPIILYCFITWLVIIYFTKIRLIAGLGISAVLLISVALMMPMLEALLDLFMGGTISLFWSWLITAPCLAAAALLILLNKNKRFREEMAKRLHF